MLFILFSIIGFFLLNYLMAFFLSSKDFKSRSYLRVLWETGTNFEFIQAFISLVFKGAIVGLILYLIYWYLFL